MNNVPTADDLWGNKGEPPMIEPGRVIAHPLPILSIKPDLRQPRRIIPSAVRGEWDGTPEDMPTVLANWHAIVEQRLGVRLDLPKVLTGGEITAEKFDDPLIEAYIELLRLAASIHRDGLINPIRVARYGMMHLIESGERRWAAYWLLSLHVSGDYDRIPAVEKDNLDVWAQAAENGARSPLNAIGMARQLALLVMDMYQDDSGVKFDAYDQMVLPGECDRKFYAQVANGRLYPIKRGLGERIQQVTGIKNTEMISRYRALLSIPDTVWQLADEQDWAEFKIRDYVDSLPKDDSSPESSVRTDTSILPIGNIEPDGITGDGREESSKSLTPEVGDLVRTKTGHVGKITEIYGSMAWVDGFGGNRLDLLTIIEKAAQPALSLPPVDETAEMEGFDAGEDGSADEAIAEEESPAATSSRKVAVELLNHAYWLLENNKGGGWITADSYTSRGWSVELEHVYEQRFIEAKNSASSHEVVVRITRAGCEAIGKPYIDLDTPPTPFSPQFSPKEKQHPDDFVYQIGQRVKRPSGVIGVIEQRHHNGAGERFYRLKGDGYRYFRENELDAAPKLDNTESTVPILKDYANPNLEAVLSLLRRLTQDKDLQREIMDIQSASRAAMYSAAMLTPEDWIEHRRHLVIALQTLVIEQVMKPINVYVNHLNEIAREFNPGIDTMSITEHYEADILAQEGEG